MSDNETTEVVEDDFVPMRTEYPGSISNDQHCYPVGRKVMIRTVTHYTVAWLVAVYDQELVVERAVWIADTGRWTEALFNGSLKEAEPFPPGEVIIGRGAIIDVTLWNHAIPTDPVS